MIENREIDCILVLCRKYSYIVGYMFVSMIYVDFISSLYLLVFGDDRVRGTREQRMLMQVVLVMLKHGVRDSMGIYYYVLLILVLEMICKLLRDIWILFHFMNYETMFIYTVIKVLNSPRFWGMRFIHKCDIFMILLVLFI